MERDESATGVTQLREALTLRELLALDERLVPDSFRVVAGTPADIPEIVRLLNTRRMPSRLPLKFARTDELLAATWPQVHWLLARRGGRLAGCIELRPVEGEVGAWEIGSFSQARDCFNPRVPVKLFVAALRALVAIGAHEAVVEIHRDNAAAWRFLAHLPFEPEGRPSAHPDFIRRHMRLREARSPRDPEPEGSPARPDAERG